MKYIGLLILVTFYTVYIGKIVLQKRKGIQTDQIAKGKQKTNVFYIELTMKIATHSLVIAEIYSLFLVPPHLPQPFVIGGMILGFIGDILL